MKNYAGFLTIGLFRVAMGHVASVQFSADGSTAVVHTMSSNMTTSDPDEIADLHAFVGDDERNAFETYEVLHLNRGPASDPAPAQTAPGGPRLVPAPEPETVAENVAEEDKPGTV